LGPVTPPSPPTNCRRRPFPLAVPPPSTKREGARRPTKGSGPHIRFCLPLFPRIFGPPANKKAYVCRSPLVPTCCPYLPTKLSQGVPNILGPPSSIRMTVMKIEPLRKCLYHKKEPRNATHHQRGRATGPIPRRFPDGPPLRGPSFCGSAAPPWQPPRPQTGNPNPGAALSSRALLGPPPALSFGIFSGDGSSPPRRRPRKNENHAFFPADQPAGPATPG